MQYKRRMTAAEFDAVCPLLKFSEDRLNATRSALVDGQSLVDVATVYGWTRQAMSKSVKVVWDTFERYQESQRAAARGGQPRPKLPEGWEEVTLIAPRDLIAKFKREIAEVSPQSEIHPQNAKNKK